MHKEEELQLQDSMAGMASNNAEAEGYKPYGRDVLADVARKQREHLLGAKIGATSTPFADNGNASCWQILPIACLVFLLS